MNQGADDRVPEVEVKNEMDLPPGRYGWCVVCRRPADTFCPETKAPIYSPECQKRHLVECAALDAQDTSDNSKGRRSSVGSTGANFTLSEDAETAL